MLGRPPDNESANTSASSLGDLWSHSAWGTICPLPASQPDRASLCYTAEVSNLAQSSPVYNLWRCFQSLSASNHFPFRVNRDSAAHPWSPTVGLQLYPRLPQWASLSTCSGLPQRSILTTRRPGRFQSSTQSTNMDVSSSSPTWASSLPFGHGKYPLHIVIPTIAYTV